MPYFVAAHLLAASPHARANTNGPTARNTGALPAPGSHKHSPGMGAPLETVTVQHERAKAPRAERISRNVKRAIDHMVFEGLSRQKAAEKAGLADHSLYQALRKSPVLAYLNAQQQVLRTSAAARSIARVDILADDAKSESVKLRANELLLGIEGIGPVQRIENTHIHRGSVPGLTIVFAAPQPAHQFTEQAHQSGLPQHINELPVPVPHPSMRNAAVEADFVVLDQPADATPGGQK